MNIDLSAATIQSLAINQVGNQTAEEALVLAKKETVLDDTLTELLGEYFLTHFKSIEQYHFYHDADLGLNEVYSYASKILENPETLIEQSVHLATHLYNQSTHPKIKGGEFYVVHFNNCIIDDEVVDAVGLFKSENKDTFLEVAHIADCFEIDSRKGININKLDKGCLILNTQKEQGFVVSIVDNTNNIDAQYWIDNFLSIQAIRNEFHQTSEFLGVTKKYLTQQIQEDFEVNKADQIDFMNRSVDYFKKHETFDQEDFEEEVFGDDEKVIESFRSFNQSYLDKHELEIPSSFEISDHAVKKQARSYKSVLKLDKNFHIYIHGDRQLIEQGTDDDGRKFYKIFYEQEQ